MSPEGETCRELGQNRKPHLTEEMIGLFAAPSNSTPISDANKIVKYEKKKKVMLIIFQDGWSAKSRDTRSITTTKQARKGSITNILSL